MTDTVEELHATILRLPAVVGAAPVRRTRGLPRLVYGSVRGITRAVGLGIDAALGLAEALPAAKAGWRGRDRAVAALNGLLGDRLAADGEPFATAMELRSAGPAAATDAVAGRRLVVLVHGAFMDDGAWRRRGRDHGGVLARELGYTPVYLRYNSGLRVSHNGAMLARLLEDLLARCELDELAIVGYSMGGLVARSACHQAMAAGLAWPRRLERLVFLGTPHHGAGLERAGNRLQAVLRASPYTAGIGRLGGLRSAGIVDLRHGNLLASDWQAHDRFDGADRRTPVPLPPGVACWAAAASRTRVPVAGRRLAGDGLVSVASALGRHPDAEHDLGIPGDRTWIGHGMHHFDLLDHPEVAAVLLRWLA